MPKYSTKLFFNYLRIFRNWKNARQPYSILATTVRVYARSLHPYPSQTPFHLFHLVFYLSMCVQFTVISHHVRYAHKHTFTYALVGVTLFGCVCKRKKSSKLRDSKPKSVRDRGPAIGKRKRGRENCFVSVYLCRLSVRARNYILCVHNRIILENSLHIFELRIP